MPKKGRPRLSEEDFRARIAAYCHRYDVAPGTEGLPPFPTGKRETRQHREWIAVYKAHRRLVRRGRGQCERCPEPAAESSVFCEAHRAGPARRAGNRGASPEECRRLLAAQRGKCPICHGKVDLSDSIDRSHATGEVRGIMHPRCHQLVGLAEREGPEMLGRLRAYLWRTTPAKKSG